MIFILLQNIDLAVLGSELICDYWLDFEHHFSFFFDLKYQFKF